MEEISPVTESIVKVEMELEEESENQCSENEGLQNNKMEEGISSSKSQLPESKEDQMAPAHGSQPDHPDGNQHGVSPVGGAPSTSDAPSPVEIANAPSPVEIANALNTLVEYGVTSKRLLDSLLDRLDEETRRTVRFEINKIPELKIGIPTSSTKSPPPNAGGTSEKEEPARHAPHTAPAPLPAAPSGPATCEGEMREGEDMDILPPPADFSTPAFVPTPCAGSSTESRPDEADPDDEPTTCKRRRTGVVAPVPVVAPQPPPPTPAAPAPLLTTGTIPTTVAPPMEIAAPRPPPPPTAALAPLLIAGTTPTNVAPSMQTAAPRPPPPTPAAPAPLLTTGTTPTTVAPPMQTAPPQSRPSTDIESASQRVANAILKMVGVREVLRESCEIPLHVRQPEGIRIAEGQSGLQQAATGTSTDGQVPAKPQSANDPPANPTRVNSEPSGERRLKMIIQRLPPCVTEEEVYGDLMKYRKNLQGDNIPDNAGEMAIHKVGRFENQMATASFFVTLPPGDNGEWFRGIRTLRNSQVKVDVVKPRKGATQCSKCQRWGHTANCCFMTTRNTKCTEPGHSSKQSQLPHKRVWGNPPPRPYQPPTRPSKPNPTPTSSLPTLFSAPKQTPHIPRPVPHLLSTVNLPGSTEAVNKGEPPPAHTRVQTQSEANAARRRALEERITFQRNTTTATVAPSASTAPAMGPSASKVPTLTPSALPHPAPARPTQASGLPDLQQLVSQLLQSTRHVSQALQEQFGPAHQSVPLDEHLLSDASIPDYLPGCVEATAHTMVQAPNEANTVPWSAWAEHIASQRDTTMAPPAQSASTAPAPRPSASKAPTLTPSVSQHPAQGTHTQASGPSIRERMLAQLQRSRQQVSLILQQQPFLPVLQPVPEEEYLPPSASLPSYIPSCVKVAQDIARVQAQHEANAAHWKAMRERMCSRRDITTAPAAPSASTAPAPRPSTSKAPTLTPSQHPAPATHTEALGPSVMEQLLSQLVRDNQQLFQAVQEQTENSKRLLTVAARICRLLEAKYGP